MTKDKILKRGKKKKPKKKLSEITRSVNGASGILKKNENNTWESSAVKAGKAPKKEKRNEIKTNIQDELKQINNQKQASNKSKKLLANKANLSPKKKPSTYNKAVTKIKNTISNTIRKGISMLKKKAQSAPKNIRPTRTVKRSAPKR